MLVLRRLVVFILAEESHIDVQFVKIDSIVCMYIQSNLVNMKLLNMKYLLTWNTSQVQVQIQA